MALDYPESFIKEKNQAFMAFKPNRVFKRLFKSLQYIPVLG